MYRSVALMLVCAACVALCVASCSPPEDLPTAETVERTLLPMPGFAERWQSDGNMVRYTPDTLFEFINGEAELYMPYGFMLATVTTYHNGDNSIEAAVYEMGSLLEAFGVFSNYRYADDPVPPFGSDGGYGDRQLIFYQDKYLVRINAHGEWPTRRDAMLECGKAIATRLPQPARPPAELDTFKFEAIEPRTEVYHAESVLGYAFFPKGFVAQANLDDESVRVFVVTTDTAAGAETSMQRYLDYLEQENVEPEWISAAAGKCLVVQDPLYKGTIACRTGPYLLGAIELSDPAQGVTLIDQLYARLPSSG